MEAFGKLQLIQVLPAMFLVAPTKSAGIEIQVSCVVKQHCLHSCLISWLLMFARLELSFPHSFRTCPILSKLCQILQNHRLHYLWPERYTSHLVWRAIVVGRGRWRCPIWSMQTLDLPHSYTGCRNVQSNKHTANSGNGPVHRRYVACFWVASKVRLHRKVSGIRRNWPNICSGTTIYSSTSKVGQCILPKHDLLPSVQQL